MPLVYLLAAFCLSAAAYGQQVWERPYQQWSKKEAQLILNDSPWAKSYSVEVATGDNLNRVVMPSTIARLRSALPIRQALLRLKQLGTKYDKLSAEKKAKFDAEAKKLLECSLCATFYIISLKYESEALEKAPLDKLQPNIFLTNDKGEQRTLVRLIREKEELLFLFERFDRQGNPLLTAASQQVNFSINTKELFKKKLLLPFIPGRYTFDVSGLMQNGQVAF
jgi:hypothetical protein